MKGFIQDMDGSYVMRRKVSYIHTRVVYTGIVVQRQRNGCIY